MKHYKCLANDSSLASAVFVPFYAGLDLGRFLWGFNTSVRDALSENLVNWLKERPEWRRMWGRDHFLVGGRVSWDFRRETEKESEWGSKLMFLPESNNMTMLSIETSLWTNDFAIPYPTYFHPSNDNEVFAWQRTMRKRKRPYLFSFVGAPRPDSEESIRGEIIKQCQSSKKLCKFLDCNDGGTNCDEPANVMKVFERSVFCLQPSGDSYTRRSTFDSILAGCVPVFFNPGSCFKQYLWHFPKNYTKYSVFIPENEVREKKISIGETLLKVPKDEVLAMREEVIRLISSIVYANPTSSLKTLEDAFDIAVKGVLERVRKVRKAIEDGKDPGIGFAELNTKRFEMWGPEHGRGGGRSPGVAEGRRGRGLWGRARDEERFRRLKRFHSHGGGEIAGPERWVIVIWRINCRSTGGGWSSYGNLARGGCEGRFLGGLGAEGLTNPELVGARRSLEARGGGNGGRSVAGGEGGFPVEGLGYF
ncbi:hypothetical protein TIFTF001_039638 [Ficus carica]|nr:hypothetical protein TIFTF001_039638 [Ficus carica]